MFGVLSVRVRVMVAHRVACVKWEDEKNEEVRTPEWWSNDEP